MSLLNIPKGINGCCVLYTPCRAKKEDSIVSSVVNFIIEFMAKWNSKKAGCTAFGFFTLKKSDAFLSDYLTDLKLHRTK